MNKVKEMELDGKIQIREKKKISVFESEDATSPLTPSIPEEPGSSMRRGVPAGREGGDHAGQGCFP